MKICWQDLPSKLDVLVNDASDSHGQKGVVPAAHKHDSDTHDDSKQRKGPKKKRRVFSLNGEVFLRLR